MKIALRASQHCVIIDNYRHLSGLLTKLASVNGCQTGNHTIGSSLDLERFSLFAPTLSRHRQLTIFNKRVFITEIIKIFPGRAITLGMTPRHRITAQRIRGIRQLLLQRLQHACR